MKKNSIERFLIIIIGLLLSSCQTTKYESTTNSYQIFMTSNKDSIDDLYYNYWKPAKSTAYYVKPEEINILDIAECTVDATLSNISFIIKTRSKINEYIVSENTEVEWGFYIDEDKNILSGRPSPMTTNDIGPEIKISLIKNRYDNKCLITQIRKGKQLPVEYSINNDIIKFVVPRESIKTSSFNYVAFSLKTYSGNNSQYIQSIDTVPDVGHFYSLGNQIKDKEFPVKVARYLSSTFTSKSRPSSPYKISIEALFKEKYGDCDEYAILAMYILRKSGIEAYMLQIDFNEWWKEYNIYKRHDVCIFKDEDQKWGYLDIYDISRSVEIKKYSTIEEICNQLPSHYNATDWIKFNLYDHTGEIIKTVKK